MTCASLPESRTVFWNAALSTSTVITSSFRNSPAVSSAPTCAEKQEPASPVSACPGLLCFCSLHLWPFCSLYLRPFSGGNNMIVRNIIPLARNNAYDYRYYTGWFNIPGIYGFWNMIGNDGIMVTADIQENVQVIQTIILPLHRGPWFMVP